VTTLVPNDSATTALAADGKEINELLVQRGGLWRCIDDVMRRKERNEETKPVRHHTNEGNRTASGILSRSAQEASQAQLKGAGVFMQTMEIRHETSSDVSRLPQDAEEEHK
jgi:hypothetical protein